MSAVKKSISLPDQLYQRALHQQEAFGYPTFSDYLQALIRADVSAQQQTHTFVAEKYPPASEQALLAQKGKPKTTKRKSKAG